MKFDKPYYLMSGSNFEREIYREHFHGFIDPSVQMRGPITLGIGVIIEENCILGGNNFFGHRAVMRPGCCLGKGSEMRVNSWMANDCHVGDYTVIYNYANLAMGTRVGNYVYFGSKSIAANADEIVLHRKEVFTPNPVTIDDGARIAILCCIRPGVTIGMNALIGMGSTVTKDVPRNQVWYGNPAEFVKMVPKDDVPAAWNAAKQFIEKEQRDELK